MKFLKVLFKILFTLSFVAVIAAGVGIYSYVWPQLPSVDNLQNVKYQVPLRVYTADKQLIAEFGEKRRIPVKYEDTPELMIQAFVASEDDRFFTHPGVDYKGLLRAAIQLILTGKKRQGGSTITMQVARNFYLTREKTYTRKINEIFLALKIESRLTKSQILSLYLNKIYLGNRAYGIGAAAQIYYGKKVGELNLAQTAMIAGLPKAPSRYNPIANPERATIRRNYVLLRMLDLGKISQADYDIASSAQVSAEIHRAEVIASAPYMAEMVRKYMTDQFGSDAYTNGYNVYTTIDSNLQNVADESIRNTLDDYDYRHGWRQKRNNNNHVEITASTTIAELDLILKKSGSVAHLIPAIITEIQDQKLTVYSKNKTTHSIDWNDINWARTFITEDKKGPKLKTAADQFQVGDLIKILSYQTDDNEQKWRIAQVPKVAGALISISPVDGHIIALTGGYSYFDSKFNRVTQAQRQPGSGFKAFIYSAALEYGYTASSIINDAPVVFNDRHLEGSWRPENYSGKFFGPTRLRYALTKSRNLISIRLVRDMGIKYTLAHAENFGFDAKKLPHNLSISLGSASVTPLQMSRGYAVLANGGYLIEPYFIQSIEEGPGNIIYIANPATVCEDCASTEIKEPLFDIAKIQNKPETILAKRVISKENRFIMYSMMQDVIQLGTARKARVLKRKDLAGKTGTTNDQRDAWFNGYNQSIVTNTWVGFDDNSKLGRGEVGGRAALPAWIRYMREALKEMPDNSPEIPESMVTVKIDPKTGLRAPVGMDKTIFEIFRSDHIPKVLVIEETIDEVIIEETNNDGETTIKKQSNQSIVDDLF